MKKIKKQAKVSKARNKRAKAASAAAVGAQFSVLVGRASTRAVISVFGKVAFD